MNISLDPRLEKFVQESVQAGKYDSASDMVNGALAILQCQESLLSSNPAELEELRRKIKIGLDQLDRGEGIHIDAKDLPDYFEIIKQRGRQKLSSQAPQT